MKMNDNEREKPASALLYFNS